MDSASSGDWDNYHVVGEHMHSVSLFLEQIYKNAKFSSKFFSECLDAG
jgi:hypothetical protein